MQLEEGLRRTIEFFRAAPGHMIDAPECIERQLAQARDRFAAAGLLRGHPPLLAGARRRDAPSPMCIT